MAIHEPLVLATGNWTGTSKLFLPWLPAEEQIKSSPSLLSIKIDPAQAYAELAYTWTYEGQPKTGTMLVATDPDSEAASIGWVDSWHQSPFVMKLSGTRKADGVSCAGTYSAGEGPDWGWRIELIASGDQFQIKMTNIMPEGEECWAVDGVYTRA